MKRNRFLMLFLALVAHQSSQVQAVASLGDLFTFGAKNIDNLQKIKKSKTFNTVRNSEKSLAGISAKQSASEVAKTGTNDLLISKQVDDFLGAGNPSAGDNALDSAKTGTKGGATKFIEFIEKQLTAIRNTINSLMTPAEKAARQDGNLLYIDTAKITKEINITRGELNKVDKLTERVERQSVGNNSLDFVKRETKQLKRALDKLDLENSSVALQNDRQKLRELIKEIKLMNEKKPKGKIPDEYLEKIIALKKQKTELKETIDNALLKISALLEKLKPKPKIKKPSILLEKGLEVVSDAA